MVCSDIYDSTGFLDCIVSSKLRGDSPMSALLKYLERRGTDHRRRTAGDVLIQSNQFWEKEHDFLQWLLPLPEKSMSVPNSPVLRGAEVRWIRESPVAQVTIRRAANRFLNFLKDTESWRTYANHNHLRITRSIKSIRLLVSKAEAVNFQAKMLGILGEDFELINDKTKCFWSYSVK